MIKLKTILCADGVVRDTETNAISIFNIIEELSAIGFPFFKQLMQVYISFERKPKDLNKFNCDVVFRLNNKELLTVSFQPEFEGKLKNRTIITVQGIVLPGPGLLKVFVRHENRSIGSYDIIINYIGKQKTDVDQSIKGKKKKSKKKQNTVK